jgi:hypothetical protein
MWRPIFLLFLSGWLGAAPAHAAEKILAFDLVAELHRNGSLDMVENITVKAEGDHFKRGLFRDIPTRYRDSLGNQVSMRLAINGIEKDGHPEPYRVEQRDNGIRIHAGDQGRLLTAGKYRYTLRYTVKRAIGFYDGYDEWYWNVTGNGWNIPIEKASAQFLMPVGAAALRHDGYTGPQGSQDRHFKAQVDDNSFTAATTRALAAGEGFTVAVAFPKNVVVTPSVSDRIADFLQDNSGWIMVGIIAVVTLMYHSLMWSFFGMDPPGDVIVPRFAPPVGIPASLLRYVMKQGYDRKVFACLLVEAAVKHHLVINDTRDKTEILYKPNDATHPLSGMEKHVLRQLFYEQKTLDLPRPGQFQPHISNAERMELSRRMRLVLSEHQSCLLGEESRYFFTGPVVKAFGFLLMAVSIPLIMSFAVSEEQALLLGIVSFVLLLIINLMFFRWHNLYTPMGRKLADYAEGFRQFLVTAEQARSHTDYPQDITPDLFDEMLPYAIALDAEQEWCNRFAQSLMVQEQQGQAYHPSWYRSPSRTFSPSLSMVLGTSLVSSIASAVSPPGSASGSSRRGFSGGGGGDGGGW